jgi:hypothetical protein
MGPSPTKLSSSSIILPHTCSESVLLRHMLTVFVHHAFGGMTPIGPAARHLPGSATESSCVRSRCHGRSEGAGERIGPRCHKWALSLPLQGCRVSWTTCGPTPPASPKHDACALCTQN